MTSSKQGLRLHSTPQSHIPNSSQSSADIRTGSISLHVNGSPEELRPFFDLSSKVASCFRPSFNVIESSSNKETISRTSSSRSSTSSSSSSSTLSLKSKDGSLSGCSNDSRICGSSEIPGNPENSSHPSFSITIFLRLLDADPGERLKPNATPRDRRASSVLKVFKTHPWKLHHTEYVNNVKVKGKINPLTNNPPEFYHVSQQLPIWGLRHVHYGREHVRVVLNTTHSLWDDQVQFYTLVLGLDHDLLREDFCLFTVQREPNLDYDVQLALKRLPQNVSLQVLESVQIQIKVKDLGKLVALFPNVCEPISDILWQTTDHDGNKVLLNVVRNRQHKRTAVDIDDVVYECMVSPIQNYQKILANSKCTQTSLNDNNRTDQDVSRLSKRDDNVYMNSFDTMSNVYVNCDKYLCNVSSSSSLEDNHNNNNDNNSNNNSKTSIVKKYGKNSTGTDLCDDDEGIHNFSQTQIENTKGIVLSDDDIHVFRFSNDQADSLGKSVQEDEESLTLTNLSEESGIIVLQDDEGAWCDGEGEGHAEIRPCLRKHTSSSTASRSSSSSNRKVRFSDEIRAFAADDSQSRLSSGFESDEQSDEDLDDRQFNNSSRTPHQKQFTNSTGTNSFRESNFQNESMNNMTKVNPHAVRVNNHSKKSNFRTEPNRQAFPNVPGTVRVNTSQLEKGRSHPPSPSTMFRPICPPSYEVALAMKKKSQLEATKNVTAAPGVHPPHLHKNHLNNANSNMDLEKENATSLYDSRHFNTQNIQQCEPLTPVKHIVKSSNVKDLKSEMDLSKRQQQNHKADSKSRQNHRVSSEIVSPKSSQCQDTSDDITTNFTLRFDTCPMSGGQPRQEQTGFYV